MIKINKMRCSCTISWITNKFKRNLTVTIPLKPSVFPQDRLQTGNDNKVPTISAEVQELTFDRNGIPNVIIVKSSESTSEDGSNKSPSQTSRWAFPLSCRIQVEDLQQSNDMPEMTDHLSGSTQTKSCTSKAKEITDWKPSRHLHKYFRMMYICDTAPLHKHHVVLLEGQDNWNILIKLQRVNLKT